MPWGGGGRQRAKLWKKKEKKVRIKITGKLQRWAHAILPKPTIAIISQLFLKLHLCYFSAYDGPDLCCYEILLKQLVRCRHSDIFYIQVRTASRQRYIQAFRKTHRHTESYRQAQKRIYRHRMTQRQE